MALEYDASVFDDDQSDEAIGEERDPVQFVTKVGSCHLTLMKFDEFLNGKNRHRFIWEVLAHDEADQSGRQLVEYLNHPQASQSDKGKFATKMLMRRAVALGLTTVEEIERLKRERKLPSTDFKDAVNSQCFATLKLGDEYNGERRIEINGIFPPHDKRCEKFPRNAAFFAKVSSGSSLTTATSPATTPPAQSEPASPFSTSNV